MPRPKGPDTKTRQIRMEDDLVTETTAQGALEGRNFSEQVRWSMMFYNRLRQQERETGGRFELVRRDAGKGE